QRRRAEGFDDEIAARDRIDSSRQLAPLAIAAEAEVIDTSALTITGVVAEILGRLAANGFVPRR
ncbi:MAG: (d)CMP kinase, partial [Chthoniobacterales bacterium]